MVQIFIDQTSDFAVIVAQEAAREWVKKAVSCAKTAGKSVDGASIYTWLDVAASEEMKGFRESNPGFYKNQHDAAVGLAHEFYAD